MPWLWVAQTQSVLAPPLAITQSQSRRALAIWCWRCAPIEQQLRDALTRGNCLQLECYATFLRCTNRGNQGAAEERAQCVLRRVSLLLNNVGLEVVDNLAKVGRAKTGDRAPAARLGVLKEAVLAASLLGALVVAGLDRCSQAKLSHLFDATIRNNKFMWTKRQQRS